MMRMKEFCQKVGLHPNTVRKLIKEGQLKPLKFNKEYRFTEDHVRQIIGNVNRNKKNVVYARVSTAKQKEHLSNQIDTCVNYLSSKGLETHEVITDIASSFNFKRKGLNKLLDEIFNGNVSIICIYSKDRLSRIAFDLFKNLFGRFGVEILVVNQSECPTTNIEIRDAVEELVSFIHYITSKIYGSRSYKTRKIKKCIEETLKNDIDNQH